MNPKLKNLLSILLAVVLVVFGGANFLGDSGEQAEPTAQVVAELAAAPEEMPDSSKALPVAAPEVDASGEYTSKEEVAAYIHLYGHLPGNYITKKEAQALGWVNSEGNLNQVAPGKSIGGDYFGNYEGLLPQKKGRKYYECDIDFNGKYRNGKRIIFSNDGLIYYTEDHYESYTLLYGEE